MTRPSGRLLSNYFVSGAGTSVQDLIFTVTGIPCFTGKHFSLKHYSGNPELPGQVIEVRSSMVPRIIFGFNTSFAQQLDRLAVILNYVQSRGNPAIKRIDLTLPKDAAVQFESGRISTF